MLRKVKLVLKLRVFVVAAPKHLATDIGCRRAAPAAVDKASHRHGGEGMRLLDVNRGVIVVYDRDALATIRLRVIVIIELLNGVCRACIRVAPRSIKLGSICVANRTKAFLREQILLRKLNPLLRSSIVIKVDRLLGAFQPLDRVV